MRTVNLGGSQSGKNAATSTRLVEAGSDPCLIKNEDATFSAFISYENSIDTAALSNCIILAPGGNIAVDGSRDVFGIGNFTTGTIDISIVEGGTSFFRPASLSALGGIKVFIQATAPTQPPTIPVNSIWLQQTAGIVTGYFTWNGSIWVQQVFNASDVIAVGTIIANLIAAGTIVGGIVDGTTIKAGSFIGGNYFGYAGGSAVAGELSVSVIPGTANVTDSVGNLALPGHTVYQTPLAVNSIAFNMQQGILTWYQWNGSSWAFGASMDWTVPNNFIEFLLAPIRSISGTRANPTLIETDGWTTFGAFGAGFQAGGIAPQQKLYPDGSIHLRGQILSSAATAANSTMVTLFGSPAQNMSWVVPTNAAGYTPAAGSLPRVITIDTAGNVRLQPTTSAANQFVLLDGVIVPQD